MCYRTSESSSLLASSKVGGKVTPCNACVLVPTPASSPGTRGVTLATACVSSEPQGRMRSLLTMSRGWVWLGVAGCAAAQPSSTVAADGGGALMTFTHNGSHQWSGGGDNLCF